MGRIDYQPEKYQFSCADEPPRLTRQWADVLEECRQLKAGAEERLRIALLNVDYVTSFELLGDNYPVRRIDSAFLLPNAHCCLTKIVTLAV